MLRWCKLSALELVILWNWQCSGTCHFEPSHGGMVTCSFPGPRFSSSQLDDCSCLLLGGKHAPILLNSDSGIKCHPCMVCPFKESYWWDLCVKNPGFAALCLSVFFPGLPISHLPWRANCGCQDGGKIPHFPWGSSNLHWNHRT